MQTVMGRCVSDVEAAAILGVSVRTIRKWRLVGDRGPRFAKLGRCVRYPLAELARFCDERMRSSTSDPGPRRAA